MSPIKPTRQPGSSPLLPGHKVKASATQHERSSSIDAASSAGSSQLSADTVAPTVPGTRRRSPTPSSFLPQPAELGGDAAADAPDPTVLKLAEQAVRRAGGLATYVNGETMVDGHGEGGVLHLAKGRELRQASVADLRASSRARRLVARRLNSIFRAIGEGRKLPAIKVDGSGSVLDGFHRLRAAELLGIVQLTVDAPQRPSSELHKSALPWRPRRRSEGS